MSLTIIAISPKKERAYAKIGYDIWLISPYIKGNIKSSNEDEMKEDICKNNYRKCEISFEYLNQALTYLEKR